MLETKQELWRGISGEDLLSAVSSQPRTVLTWHHDVIAAPFLPSKVAQKVHLMLTSWPGCTRCRKGPDAHLAARGRPTRQ